MPEEVKLTTGELSQSQIEFVQKAVMFELEDLNSDVLFKYAEKTNFDPTSDEYSWRMYKDLPETTDHLIEGVTPEGLKYRLVDFKVKVYQEGAYVPLTDKMLKYGIDKQLAISGKLLGRNAKQRMRNLLAEVVFNGLNVRYAQGSADRAAVISGTKGITLADLNAIKADFVRRNVEPVEGGKYIFVASPEVIADIKNLDAVNKSWIDVEKYGDQSDIIAGEVGSMLGFRFIESNIVPVKSTYVHLCLAFGAEAFGTVAINGEDAGGGFETIYHAPGSAGSSDALNQRGSLGWKHNGFGARILRDEALVRYECYHAAAVVSALTDSSRKGYNSESGAITPTLTAGTNMSIKVTGNVAKGNLLKIDAIPASGYHLASTVWTTASFVGVDLIQGTAGDATIFVQVKKNASAVTIVAANAVSDQSQDYKL